MPIEIDLRENAFVKWGEELGRAEGRAEGEAKILIRLLERRFGVLPNAILARVAAADVDSLDRWVDRVMDACDLDSVFAGPTLVL